MLSYYIDFRFLIDQAYSKLYKFLLLFFVYLIFFITKDKNSNTSTYNEGDSTRFLRVFGVCVFLPSNTKIPTHWFIAELIRHSISIRFGSSKGGRKQQILISSIRTVSNPNKWLNELVVPRVSDNPANFFYMARSYIFAMCYVDQTVLHGLRPYID